MRWICSIALALLATTSAAKTEVGVAVTFPQDYILVFKALDRAELPRAAAAAIAGVLARHVGYLDFVPASDRAYRHLCPRQS